MDPRKNVREMFEKKTGLDSVSATDFEIGIYNWCIKYAEDHRIIKNWTNNKFTMIYLEKARSAISNIDKDSYIKNDRLINRLKENEFPPHEIAFMRPERIFPERWKDTVDAYMKKYENAYENNQVAMSDQYVCHRCKKKEVTYYLLQTRSSDEMMTQFFRCLNCGASWRIG